jgi:membrane protein DedA with SNARE-associated domain
MTHFVPWLTTIILSLGYLGLAILVALGNIRLVPIPAEITLPLAGLLVGEGQLTFVPVLLWTTVASVVVSVILYLLGFWVGEESLRRFIKFGRFVFLYESDLDKTCEVFRRHGGIACLVGRLIPKGNGSNLDTGGHRADAHLWEVHDLYHRGYHRV